MNRDEARELLEIATLLPAEEHTAEMREALALAQGDAGLLAWFESRKAFDEKAASALAEIEPPTGLRARLIRSMEQEHLGRRRLAPLRWLALAAAIALLGAVTAVILNRNGSGDWKSEALATVREVDGGRMPLDKWSGDVTTLRKWLASEKSPTSGALPQGISDLSALGCKKVKIAGRPASIICFALPDSDQEAHLVVVQVDDAKATGPVFEAKGDWRFVTWNEAGRKLMLATRAPEEALRKMFASADSEILPSLVSLSPARGVQHITPSSLPPPAKM